MSGFSNSLSYFYGIHAIRNSESDIPIHTFVTYSIFTRVSRFVSSLDLSVSEYQTYNICNFATTYDGQTAEKVCPTYPPIYRYGAIPIPPLICSERKCVTSKPEPGFDLSQTRKPGFTEGTRVWKL